MTDRDPTIPAHASAYRCARCKDTGRERVTRRDARGEYQTHVDCACTHRRERGTTEER